MKNTMDPRLDLVLMLLRFTASIFVSRILTFLSFFGSFSLFGYVVLNPNALSLSASIFFTVLVFLPSLYFEKGGEDHGRAETSARAAQRAGSNSQEAYEQGRESVSD